MKRLRITGCGIFILAVITGCYTTPSWYRGDGQIKNNSFFADGSILCHVTEYIIRLGSFDMSTNVEKEFNLGRLSSFREPVLTICILVRDQNYLGCFDKFRSQCLNATFGYRLSNQSGILVDQPPKLLKDYDWGGREFDSNIGSEAQVGQTDVRIPARIKQEHWVSS